MHEKDVELVKLLHENCTAAEGQLARLKDELATCRTELDSIEGVRAARENYSDILRLAADALQRQDLLIELPDSGQLKSRFEELSAAVEQEQVNAGKYRVLLDQLVERAPALLEAAGLVSSPAAEPEAATDEPAASAAEPAGEAAPAESAEDPAEPVAGDTKRFNLKSIRRREKTGHGPGAVYIIDGTSVISRIPNYDPSLRSVAEQQVYEELAQDLAGLGKEISGSFCILTSLPIKLEGNVGSLISMVAPSGNGSTTAEERLHYLLRLADEYTGRLRNVCVVSGEMDVLAEVRNRGMHTMGLSEFFVA